MSVYKTTKFKKLKKEWYEKLKKIGFQDIENDHGEISDHKNYEDLKNLIGFKQDLVGPITDYYRWAEDMTNRGQFKSISDEIIWLLHSRGLSSREIAEHVPFDQSMICRKIKKIRAYLRLQESANPQKRDL